MLSKLANRLVQGLRKHGPAAALAAALPLAYGAYEAPEGQAGDVIRQAAKWTALGAVPGAALFPGEPRKAMAAAAAAGIGGADRAAREARGLGQAKKTRKLIDALGKKLVPREFKQIEQGGAQ